MRFLSQRFLTAIVAVLFLTLAACSSLPSQMPADFSLEIVQSGGMLPYSTDATYSPSGCRYQKRYQYQGQPLEADYRFPLDAGELRSLYRKLVDGSFDRITTHREEIYDRGRFQVTVKAQGQTFTVVDGGQTVVDLFWSTAWKVLYDDLSQLETTALEKEGTEVTFRLSPEIQRLKDLYIGLDLTSVSYHPDVPSNTVKTRLFPGTYVLVLGADPTEPYGSQVVTISGPRSFDLVFDGKSVQTK